MTACITCAAGYNLTSNGACSQPNTEPKCAVSNGSVCIQCKTPYNLNNGQCIDLNCQTLVTPILCGVCKSGYLLSTGGYCYDPNCNTVVNGLCTICNSNYILSNRQCIQNSTCLAYNNNNQCIICPNQYILVNGTCKDPNCNLTDSNNKCIACNKYYLRSLNGYCYDPNCNIVVNGSCSQCNANFVLISSGVCEIVIIGCFTVDLDTQQCIQCLQSYTLTANGNCTYNNPTPVTPNNTRCSNYSQTTNQCLQCLSVYALINGTCVDINCQSQVLVGNNYVCTVCKPTFNISSTGLCYDQNCFTTVNGSCTRCADSYVINQTGICQQITIGCLTFNSTTNRCIVCLPTYIMNSLGYCTLNNGVSPSIVDSATALNISTITNPDANCLQRDNNGLCTNCITRYYLISGICVAVPAQCQTYNMMTGKCITCIANYELYSQGNQTEYCVQMPNATDPNCLVTDLNSFCIRCKVGYYINNGVCYIANTMCKTFDLIGGQCLTCYDGYTLEQSNCVSLTNQATCLTYNFQNTCISCVNGYYVVNGVCTAVNSLCLTYDSVSGGCTSCSAGYSLAN